MIRFILNFFGAIFTAICIGLVFAALTVGAIFWMYGRDLPDHDQLAQYAPKTISRIYSGQGKIIDEFAEERRLFVPIEDVPDLVKEAFISAEDKNFYHHGGFDARGIAMAAFEAVRSGGQNVRGASTITQQVMKNFLLSSDRSAERKVKELILATRVEQALSKDKILELYLNEIYLGQNSYGVAAAAQTYFNKPLTALAPREAAMLASMPRAPSHYHPVRDRERLLSRRNYVLREMWQNGYITEAVYREEVAQPIQSVQGGDFPAFRDQVPPRDYFTDEIRRQLSRSFGHDEFFGGGLSIRATIDPDMQSAAADALREALEKYDRARGRWRGTGVTLSADDLRSEDSWRAALAAANVPRDVTGWKAAVVLALGQSDGTLGIEGEEGTATLPAADVQWAGANQVSDLLKVGDVVLVRKMTSDKDGSFIRWTLRQVPEVEGGFVAMDVHTGRVLAMQGGFSYEASVYNRATQAMRQPGSSFKPFVYAAALDSGFTPATIVVDAPIEVNTPQGMWRPKNSTNKFYGPTPLRTGIEQSRNVMTVRIAQEIGMNTVATYAERFGVYSPMRKFLANALGAQETTLYQMVTAYAMFANGGERVEPTLVDRVQDRWGRTVYRHDQRICENCDAESLPPGQGPRIDSQYDRIMDPITAYQLTSMMEGVVQRGTARGIHLPVPIAGKTGTTNDSKDVWFIGFSSNIVAGCYIGYDTPRSLGHAYGGSTCGPVFQSFMEKAVAKYGGGKFTVPPGGHFVKIDRFTGQRLPDNASGTNVVAEYFRDGEDPFLGGGLYVDGGFAMGQNLPLYAYGETGSDTGRAVTTSTGERAVIPGKADFGTLSSGGLY